MIIPIVLIFLNFVGAAISFGIFAWFFPGVAIVIAGLLVFNALTDGQKDLTP